MTTRPQHAARSMALAGALMLGLLLGAAPRAAAAPAPVKVVVLLESGVGGGQAQGYLDKLLGAVRDVAGWPGVASKYTTRRAEALDYIKSDKPELGLMSLGAYLALAQTQQLEVVGEAQATGAGGRQYHIVSKAGSLAACKGKAMATNHLADPRFVDNVLLHGAARLADFQVVDTPRPVQTLKAVIRDEAVCALIDDAQLAQLAKLEGGAAVKSVWQSAELPPMPIVAFPHADKAMLAGFQKALPKVCTGAGAAVCTDVGLQRLGPASNTAYAALVAAYRSNEIARP